LLHLVGDQAGEEIARAARWVADDDLHRLAGEVLRAGIQREQQQQQGRQSHRITWVWMVSERSLPLASVTRVCQTWVRLPLCSGVASARTVPARAAAKKLVLDSSVAVLWPCARLTTVPAAPTVSANAISVPPCSAPVVVSSSGRISSSATTRSFSISTKRMPRCLTSPLFQSSSAMTRLHLAREALDAHVLLERRALACEFLLQRLVSFIGVERRLRLDAVEHEEGVRPGLDALAPQKALLAGDLLHVSAVEPAHELRLGLRFHRAAYDATVFCVLHRISSSG